MNEKVKPKTH